MIKIKKVNKKIYGDIKIYGSKSESNRILILRYLYNKKIKLKNLSNCEDTKILKNILDDEKKNKSKEIYDVNHAGTTMRFLTALFSIKKNRKIILTGSNRMKQRPIKVLVSSLKKIGAKINYIEKKNYPPIEIIGKKIKGGELKINSDVSSQYISALMLIAPKLELGLKIILKGSITSKPYIKMTENILIKNGIPVIMKDKKIEIYSKKSIIENNNIEIESDWSSLSYFYSIAAISDKCFLKIGDYYHNSCQGDSKIRFIYKKFFGVKTTFNGKKIILTKKKTK